MRLNTIVLSIVILVLVFGGIGMAAAFNVWEHKPGKVTATSSNSNSADPNAVALNTPADIRGTHTFAEISEMFNVPLNDLGMAFGLEKRADLADVKAKELKTIYGNLPQGKTLETESVRVFISMYKSKSYVYSDSVYLPQSAVKILKEKAKLSKEQVMFLETHVLDVSVK